MESTARTDTRVASLKTPADFRAHVAGLGVDIPLDDVLVTHDSPLCRPLAIGSRTVGNRWTVHPMEGWDGTTTGGISDAMVRRWQRFGASGAKLIWGGEAMAVREDGRANPNQLILREENAAGIERLREALLTEHRARYGGADDLLLGFQLTHSGRFCRPYDKKKLEPRIAFRHPLLDPKFGVTSDAAILSDDEVRRLVDAFVAAAKLAQRIGADFVDIKHCHGYLLHEFLAAHTRPGPYGGSFENRTRPLREIVAGIRAEAPGLLLGVRLSMFDFVPFKPDAALTTAAKTGPGVPEPWEQCLPYRYAFGVNPERPVEWDLTEPVRFLQLLLELGIPMVNLSAGSPYYNPHIQRPALFPPSDGYQPCEDPLVGVARQIRAVAELKQSVPELVMIGSAYSYLQEYLPHVAQYLVRTGMVDSVGLGRMVLSYPEILHDAVTRGTLDRKRICRTFSDCTTAPRNGMPSGCYPLDDYYKSSPLAAQVKAIRQAL